jgi:hypothetical protein
MSEEKIQELDRSAKKDLGHVECDLLDLQCLLRVIQDSAEFTTERTTRGEKPEVVLEDIGNSLGIAAKRLGDIVTDLQEVEQQLRSAYSAT